MIRKIALVSIFLLAGLLAGAQGRIKLVQFGLKAGINTQGTELIRPNADNYAFSTDNRTGFHIGLQSRVNLALFHIQPEIVYSMNKYKLAGDAIGDGTLPDTRAKIRVNTWDFPVLIGVKALFIRLQGGPVFNLSTQNTIVPESKTVPQILYKRSSVSYMLGIGVDIIGKVTLDVRYHGQFKRPIQSIYIDGMDHGREIRTRTRNWLFSLGYMF